MDGLIAGRNVHYILPADHPHVGEHRPATIIRVVDPDRRPYRVNLCVFVDGPNDFADGGPPVVAVWRSEVPLDVEAARPGSWHWIERA